MNIYKQTILRNTTANKHKTKASLINVISLNCDTNHYTKIVINVMAWNPFGDVPVVHAGSHAPSRKRTALNKIGHFDGKLL